MTFHLWHTHKLASELAAGTLSERTGMQYMLIGTLLYAYNSYWVYGLVHTVTGDSSLNSL
jgi:hypothetical protein